MKKLIMLASVLTVASFVSVSAAESTINTDASNKSEAPAKVKHAKKAHKKAHKQDEKVAE